MIDIKKPLVCFALLGLAGAILYGPILKTPFFYDDKELLLFNPAIKNPQILLSEFSVMSVKWLTLATFFINYYFMQEDPFSYHLVSLLLHLGASVILYRVSILLCSTVVLQQTVFAKEKKMFAFFVSFIFLVHPLQTESVSYIWQRSEVLSGFFTLWAYQLYLLGRLQKKKWLFGVAGFIFCVGFYAKGTIVSLPLIILLTEYTFFKVRWIGPLLPKTFWGFVLVFFIAHFLTYYDQAGVKNNLHDEFFKLLRTHTGLVLSSEYFFTQLSVVLEYLRLCFFPVGLIFDRYYPLVPVFLNLKTVVSSVVLIGIFGAGIYFLRKNQDLLGFGIFWFFICLLPTSFAFREAFWEHRLYLSLIGFSIFVTAVCFMLIPRQNIRILSLAIVICIFSGLTIFRNQLWKNPVALLEDTAKKSPRSIRAKHNLGTMYLEQGKTQQAVDIFNEVIQIAPEHPYAYNNLGLIYAQAGQIEKAEEYFQKSIMADASYQWPYLNLAIIAMHRQDYKAAEGILRNAIPSHAANDQILIELGNFCLLRGELNEAKDFFEKAAVANPYNARVYLNLGNIYFTRQDNETALKMYRKAAIMAPELYEVYLNMGIVHYQMNHMSESLAALEKARQINPQRKDVDPIIANLGIPKN